MTADEADALAGEYVIGTLALAEREAFERALARDPALLAVVRQWERRLSSLDAEVRESIPASAVWTRIASALPRPELAPHAEQPIGAQPAAADVVLARLRRSRALWRGWALAASALAAGLAIAVGLETWGGRLALPPQQYVAVVNRGGDQPALVVRVDLASRTVLIRPVAAEPPAGRSLELWYIGPGQSPKSLGVVAGGSRELPLPAVFGSGDPSAGKATFALTVEPQGGSPTGGPTGPVVYSGELIRE
ncbi:MAG: anti-sigma factor [Alsobacter sp.]